MNDVVFVLKSDPEVLEDGLELLLRILLCLHFLQDVNDVLSILESNVTVWILECCQTWLTDTKHGFIVGGKLEFISVMR